MPNYRLLVGIWLLVSGLLLVRDARAQAFTIEIDDEKVESSSPTPTATPPAGVPSAAPATPAVGPDGKPKTDQPGAKPGETPKPEPTIKTTPRPEKPEVPPDPEELKAGADENGRVRFNFQGQPWLGVLEWLARVSELSLDWQELPADFLNLRTRRSYTVEEARDVINRHLLDRGFTMLKHGEVLSVVNIKKIDPSLVPRVSPDALDERDPHEFVKVLFPLDSMTADAALEELKPLMSPNGKLSALKNTNRVEAMDAAINLREVRDMLSHEQSHRGRKRLVREFKLEHVKAGDVIDQLRELLGLERKAPAAGGQNPAEAAQAMAMLQQQQQQQQQGGQPQPPKPAPQVHMVVNQRENSIVAQAPADQMALISEAVKLIDVPSSRAQSLLMNMNRTQVYRLAAIDPEALMKMLNDVGDLDPATRLQIDKKNHSLIVSGSLADQMAIRTLVTKLDGTDRKFEVIKLRRLEADYVAGSIEFMMGGGDKKKKQNRFNPYFDFYGMGGMQNNEEDESRKFRVDADVEHNRLLLWANPIELEEISHLLVKLGEIPGGGNMATLRVLDTIPPEEVEMLLERLRRTWPGVSPNPLEIAPAPQQPEAANPPARSPAPRSKTATPKRATDETTTQAPRSKKSNATPAAEARLLRLVQVAEAGPAERPDEPDSNLKSSQAGADALPSDAGDRPDATNSAEADLDSVQGPPTARRAPATGPAAQPIRIGRSPDGRMVISSPDTQALDRLEDLLTEITPPRKDYKIFKMKYKSTWAYGVALNLKDFFEEKDKNKPTRSRWEFFYGMPSGGDSKDDERRLSKRRPLKFIADSDSNSILVTGADQQQLKIIEELIAAYDIPESKDSSAVRKTKIVRIRHSKARVIADAVKDVYRDLLSANDPALQNNQNDKKDKRSPEAMYTYVNNFGGDDDKKPDTPTKFKGLLSIGVDELSNTLVVSAAEGLVEAIVATIEALDDAALPTVNRMQVLKIDRNIDADELQKRLKNLVTKPPQPRVPQPQQQPNQNGQQPVNPDSTVVIDNN